MQDIKTAFANMLTDVTNEQIGFFIENWQEWATDPIGKRCC